jgi:phage terminase large subunit GpA-like protein
LGDAILELVITKGVDVVNVTNLRRSATTAQRVALWWRSPVCRVQDCGRTQRLEIDHRTGWAKTRRTQVDDLDPLCEHHHDLKTYDGWALVEGEGTRPMVAPDDPRHPRNRPPPDP